MKSYYAPKEDLKAVDTSIMRSTLGYEPKFGTAAQQRNNVKTLKEFRNVL